MILVHGRDASFVGDVVTHLRDRGHHVQGVPADAHLFSEVVAHRAGTVIGLAASRQAASEGEREELVQALIAASNAPTSPRVVLVTPGPLEGSLLGTLKRSGAPYVVVTSPGDPGIVALPRTQQKLVWVSRQLLEPEHRVVTKAALLCTIAEAVAEETGAGLELTPQGASWRDALRETGVRVLAVPNWLARLAYRLGAAALYLEKDRARARLGQGEAAPVFGVLPSTTPAV